MKNKKDLSFLSGLCVRADGARHILQCDGKPLITPAGHSYGLPVAVLAEAVADEWRSQREKIVPSTMPLTQLAATAIDIVGKDRERIVRQMVSHAATELLCHRASSPPELVHRQQELWQPFLDWCAFRFGALLIAGEGVMPVHQTPGAIQSLHKAVMAYDDFVLAGVSCAVEASGSLVLGLALAEKTHPASEIFRAAELDASFQALTWGVDPVTSARFDAIRRDLENCERWFALLGS